MPRILVVDDNGLIRFQMINFLKRILYGSVVFDIDEAADGEKASMLCSQRKYALILTDYKMPKKNGFELAQAVRESEKNASTAIICITAAEPEELKDLRRDFVEKIGLAFCLSKSGFFSCRTNHLSVMRLKTIMALGAPDLVENDAVITLMQAMSLHIQSKRKETAISACAPKM